MKRDLRAAFALSAPIAEDVGGLVGRPFSSLPLQGLIVGTQQVAIDLLHGLGDDLGLGVADREHGVDAGRLGVRRGRDVPQPDQFLDRPQLLGIGPHDQHVLVSKSSMNFSCCRATAGKLLLLLLGGE